MDYVSEFTLLFLKLLGKLDKQDRYHALKAIVEAVMDPRELCNLFFQSKFASNGKLKIIG